jgi:hypothetical protein
VDEQPRGFGMPCLRKLIHCLIQVLAESTNTVATMQRLLEPIPGSERGKLVDSRHQWSGRLDLEILNGIVVARDEPATSPRLGWSSRPSVCPGWKLTTVHRPPSAASQIRPANAVIGRGAGKPVAAKRMRNWCSQAI